MDSDNEARLMLAACNAATEVFVDACQEEEDAALVISGTDLSVWDPLSIMECVLEYDPSTVVWWPTDAPACALAWSIPMKCTLDFSLFMMSSRRTSK
jgi:hypothetical protein